MNLGIVGIGHAFAKQFNAIKQTSRMKLVALCDLDKAKLDKVEGEFFRTTNYKELANICGYVLIASPPDTHYEISKFFIENKIGIFLEKPIVVDLMELDLLNSLIDENEISFYNTLHFSFGNEILWFKENLNKFGKPKKIRAKIFDRYVEDGKIKPESISLHGAYLDESINPLSAIAKIFGYDIVSKNLKTKKFDNDEFDYYSKSEFILDKDVEIEIEVDWNANRDDKYIDLLYENKTIRLNSQRQCVEDLTNKKLLYRCSGDRMTNHYINSFKEFFEKKDNKEISIKLHRELLKIYED